MFDQLVEAATGSRAPAAVGAWARLENAACAQRLFATADELERMYAASGSAEREQWCADNWTAVAASVAAAQQVSLGVVGWPCRAAPPLGRTTAPKPSTRACQMVCVAVAPDGWSSIDGCDH